MYKFPYLCEGAVLCGFYLIQCSIQHMTLLYSEFTVLQMQMMFSSYKGGIALWELPSMSLQSYCPRNLHRAVQTSGPLVVSYTKWFLVCLHSDPGMSWYYTRSCCCCCLLHVVFRVSQ